MLPRKLNDSERGSNYQLEKRTMTSTELFERNDALWAQRHNDRLRREALENAKQRDEEIQRRRREWEALPDEKKVCTVCGLQLTGAQIARITESPMSPRHHDFCNSFNISSGVVRGLLGLLRSVFGEEEIPLESLSNLIDAWNRQGGRCSVSKIQLHFFLVEETKVDSKPHEYSSLISQIDQEAMRLRDKEARQKAARLATLHTPVIVFDSEGKLTLVSKTIQKMRQDLTDREFFDLIQILHAELKSVPQRIQEMTSDYRWGSPPPKVVGGIR